jgi:hypothetical protein
VASLLATSRLIQPRPVICAVAIEAGDVETDRRIRPQVVVLEGLLRWNSSSCIFQKRP